MSLRGSWYRMVMRLAHKFHWHYAPPIYPEGDTMLWCQWCGFRAIVRRKDWVDSLSPTASREGEAGR